MEQYRQRRWADMLKMTNVTFAFDKKNIFIDFSMELNKGEILAVMGPSGCGKTTLLGLVAGLLKPQSGEIQNSFEKTAYVFQEPRLFPWLTVKENLLVVMNEKDTNALKTVMECLSLVGLDDALDKYPSELSGGMKSRASLARALAFGGDLFLLDEPFSALDEELRLTLSIKIKDYLRARGASAILVTHNREDAESIADRTLIFPLTNP
ncbi:MAG: ATP-binding cassette domain-containing protein [Ruminococcaceae bacterium]|nr:ATP-binding cassette domain-containing protein [Oscillospiraceae bacterium]